MIRGRSSVRASDLTRLRIRLLGSLTVCTFTHHLPLSFNYFRFKLESTTRFTSGRYIQGTRLSCLINAMNIKTKRTSAHISSLSRFHDHLPTDSLAKAPEDLCFKRTYATARTAKITLFISSFTWFWNSLHLPDFSECEGPGIYCQCGG